MRQQDRNPYSREKPMTTTTTDAPATTEAPAEAKPVPTLDDFGRMAVERLVTQVTERNANVERLASVGGDRISRLDSLREALANGEGDTTLVNVQKQIDTLMEKVATLQENRDKALNEVIDKEIAASDIDPAALDEVIKTQDGAIRTGVNYLVGLYGEDVKNLLPDLKTRSGRRSASGGAASGKRRLRGFDVYVNGVIATSPDKDGNQKSSFSAAAKVIGLDSVDPLSGKYRELYGNDPDKFPADTEFEFAHDDKVFTVRAVRDAK